MKTITFNKNSWYYHLVKNYPLRFEYEIKEDLCGYIRQFIYSLFTVIFVTLVITILIQISICPILYYFLPEFFDIYFVDEIVTLHQKSIFEINTKVGIGMILDANILAVTLVVFYTDYLSYKIKEIKSFISINDKFYVRRQPSFLGLMYKSIKEKTCFKIEFKD